MGSGSSFRVGTDVELWRVVGHLCLLLLFLVLLEQLLHRLELALTHHPKYFEMLRKIYRELMILGLLSLGIKVVKELALADAEGKNLLAFQAADIVIFLSAVALILQAICIFTALRRRNKKLEKYELVSTRDLAELISHHEAVLRSKTWLQRNWPWTISATTTVDGRALSSAHYHDMARLRVLRHFFLQSQGLPEFFPFAKYLRHAQDNQISHLIEVEITMWVLLMGISWLLDVFTESVEREYHPETPGLSLVVMVVAFAWVVTLCHMAFALYLHNLLRNVLASCGHTTARHRLKCLRTIAADEEQRLADDLLDNAVEKMQRVQDEKELEQVGKVAKYRGLARHDTGLQVLVLLYRRLCGNQKNKLKNKNREGSALAPPKNRRLRTIDSEEDLEQGIAEAAAMTQSPTNKSHTPSTIHQMLRLFSRKVLHFVVKLLLVLNGFFSALMCQAVLYDLPLVYSEFGVAVTVLIPLPLVLNIAVLQPRIFRDYVLIACLFKVDVATLSEVITQFSEGVELRTEFVSHLTSRMRDHGQTVADLRRHFHVSDPTGSGLVELEELRQILRYFGCQVSYFRFNDVAKLLFRLHGTCVEYAQVERLVELAEMEDNVTASHPTGAPHYLRTVMTEVAELHQRERCSTMEPVPAWRVLHSTSSQSQHFRMSTSFMSRAGVPILTPITPQLGALASPLAMIDTTRTDRASEAPPYFVRL